MSFGGLLASFEKIGDDPDRIQQFRKIAIALAFSGNLDTPSTTMPPEKILDAVEQVKVNLIKKGELPKQKKFDALTDEDFPESFSGVSRFARLGTLARIEKGQTGIQQAQPGTYPLVVTAAEQATCDHFDFDGAAAIVPLVSSTGHGNASLNRLHYQEGKFALGTILVAIFPHDPNLISARFIFEYLSAFKDELLVARMTGTANVTLSVGRVAEVPVPLVCPKVQAKVDELMALCDQLEQARVGREAVRDRLTTASLARLTAPKTNEETFQSHARFALQSLSTLTTRPDQVKTLRQTILDLAVRGKLTEQDAGDEPAAELLKRIRAAHPKRKNLKEHEFGVPSQLADGWSVAHLDAVASFENGDRSSNYPSGSEIKSNGIPFFSTKNLTNYRLRFSDLDFITNEKFASLRSGKLVDQDILITLRGSVGKFGLFKATPSISTGFINAQLMIIRCVDSAFVPYLLRFMRSGIFSEQITRLSSGSATPQLSAGKLGEVELWLPPLAEQYRIVAKVNALMALCDQLETSLTTISTTRSKLLTAVLQEALEPAAEGADA